MTVYLVGAGPGDPDLITLRGAELLAKADVVIYDRLSVVDILGLAPDSAQLINVGKTPNGPTVPQEEINRLLVEHGQASKHVVRLQGGDPFVFARGGEEAQALIAAGIPIEVVPGVTSAIAAPGAAGIPVTMGHSSTAFTVISGHEDPSKTTQINWEMVAGFGGTIVILMGVKQWASISASLLHGGLHPDTPAAAVRWGTRPEQHTTRATLATLGDYPLHAPSTIVVGDVAGIDVGCLSRRLCLGAVSLSPELGVKPASSSISCGVVGRLLSRCPRSRLLTRPTKARPALRQQHKLQPTTGWCSPRQMGCPGSVPSCTMPANSEVRLSPRLAQARLGS